MADEPLIVTITFTRADKTMLQLVHPATENARYDLPNGIDLGDGRTFYGYEFSPAIVGEREPLDASLPESPDEEPLA